MKIIQEDATVTEKAEDNHQEQMHTKIKCGNSFKEWNNTTNPENLITKDHRLPPPNCPYN